MRVKTDMRNINADKNENLVLDSELKNTESSLQRCKSYKESSMV